MALEAVAAGVAVVGGIVGALVGVRELIRWWNNTAAQERQDFHDEILRDEWLCDMDIDYVLMWSNYSAYYANRTNRANASYANDNVLEIVQIVNRLTILLLSQRRAIISRPEAFGPMLMIYVQSLTYMVFGVPGVVDEMVPNNEYKRRIRATLRHVVDALNVYRNRITANEGETELDMWNQSIEIYNRLRVPGFPQLVPIAVVEGETVREQVVRKMRSVERAARRLM